MSAAARFSFLTVEQIDQNKLVISVVDRKKMFFNSGTMFLNAIRQLWNDVLPMPRYLDVDILKNTSRVYNPVIKFQLGQIPLNEEGELTDEVHGGRVVSAVGPGWFQVDGYHLMYLADSSAAVEAMIRPALSDPPYCVVGPCPHINSQDQLVVSTYCVSAMKVLGAVLDRIWREVGAWVADMSIRPSHAVAEATAFLLSDGRKVVVGHRVGHMFLDPIEMVVERGEVGDLNARWACFGVECI